MSSTLWKGHLSFGLISIPIKVHTSASPNKFSTNYLNPDTMSRVKQCWMDATTNELVNHKNLKKGYEHAPGQWILLDDTDLKSITLPSSKVIQLDRFVKASEISQEMIEKTYYLAPDVAGAKAYKLLSKALQKEKAVGIGSMTRLGREHIVAITNSSQGFLTLSTLFYESEIRAFESDLGPENPSKDEIELGRMLVKRSMGTLDLSSYKDEYHENMHKLIKAKTAGQSFAMPEVTETGASQVDLLAQLKASLK